MKKVQWYISTDQFSECLQHNILKLLLSQNTLFSEVRHCSGLLGPDACPDCEITIVEGTPRCTSCKNHMLATNIEDASGHNYLMPVRVRIGREA